MRGPANVRKGGDESAPRAAGPRGDAEHLNGSTAAIEGDNGMIAASVRAAYAIVERNMQEGRSAAENLCAAGVSLADPPPAHEVANRMLHLSRDLATTWIELIATLVREPDLRGIIDQLSPGHRAHRTPPSAGATTVTQRLSSRRPVEVTLSPLQLRDVTRLPGIAGLYSVAAGTSPITSVNFAARSSGLELFLAIADDQPAGAYAGVVVDADTQAPIGTLAVRILE